MKSIFSKVFFVSIILVLIGLLLSTIKHDNLIIEFTFYALSLLFTNVGIATFIANIFTFIMGTDQFVEFIREKLINIVISKDFIRNLNQDEQKKLLHMVLKPAKELSEIYSGITSYFNQYIDNSMRLFDTVYRGHMRIDGIASFSEENGRIQIEYDIDYIIYKTGEKFDPIMLGFEDKSFVHVRTIIRGHGEKEKELTDDQAKEIESSDPTMQKMMELEIPSEFNKLSQINISRRIIEYGSDHWQIFSYKTIKACDQVSISIKCEDGLIIKNCNTYGIQGNFSIEKSSSKIKVTYNDWLSPGFGVNILVARDSYHQENHNHPTTGNPSQSVV